MRVRRYTSHSRRELPEYYATGASYSTTPQEKKTLLTLPQVPQPYLRLFISVTVT